MKYSTVFALIMLFLSGSVPAFAQEDQDLINQLIDKLYSVEDFQLRFAKALEENPDFVAHADNRLFLETLTADARESALYTYATSIREVLADLTAEEINAIMEVMDTPAGPALVRLLVADQMTVDAKLTDYVATIAANGLAALLRQDSLLYTRESTRDLSEIMDGEYLDSPLTGAANIVRRRGDLQTEHVGEAVFRFGIEWLSNSKYLISPKEGNPVSLGPPLSVNIYEIDGNEFKYIWMNPDGTYGKDVLYKTGYTSYDQEVKTFRWGLTEQYLNPGTSPLPEADRLAFAAGEGHDFYPTDEALRITARFEPDTTFAKLTMVTSDSSSVTYWVAGRAHFDLGGGAQVLTLYRDIQADDPATDRLFLPFRDATSGKTSYGGGRYLNVEAPREGAVVLDFNKAYNPYCAYTMGYSCPVPPAENDLEVAVAAGVKTPR